MPSKKQNLYKKMMQDFPILYCQKSLPFTETCMCWGIEAGVGWIEPLRKLSKILEDLNVTYWKTKKIRVQADQVKEKYGTLHFYYSIVKDPPFFIRLAQKLITKLVLFIQKHVNFKVKQVQLTPKTTEEVRKAISLSEYRKELNSLCRPVNVTFEITDGTIYKTTTFERYGTFKFQPTRHLVIHWILDKLVYLRSKVNSYSPKQDEIESLRDDLEQKVEKAVENAENECYHVCEYCGKQIGTKDSPRCVTLGWTTYICKDCADKSNRNYVMDGELWNSGKRVKSKKQRNAELRRHEKSTNEKLKKQKAQLKEEVEKKISEAKALIRQQKLQIKNRKANSKKGRQT